ncbi:hypothetical protein CAPTEDRAFT_214165 [Capitella teleta]|uniref:Uncharacterized protein n=1 Tax=Capitella teleta TaxID=283909 RepID=R7TL25_CAPTE|nr:hypothetical protein CAPTEDRAFT_214165 [Capitella teleta]|eukprot:ELT94222.1 hypothetical protein CAPTEDRAFT_214165 [Capitella teleta]
MATQGNAVKGYFKSCLGSLWHCDEDDPGPCHCLSCSLFKNSRKVAKPESPLFWVIIKKMYRLRTRLMTFPFEFIYRKKQEREQKQQGSRESISDGSSNHTSGSGGSRTARPWIKDPCADAKPIADPQLRRKLNGITDCTRLSTRSRTANLNRHSAPVMSSQDQKILKMMLEKREQEKSVRDLRETNKLKREEEQMREKARKNASENQRRLSLEKSSHQRDAQKIEARQRKKTEDDSAKKEREKALAQCQKDHTLALQKQLELKRQMVHDKKLKELERRKSVPIRALIKQF